jgi:hypothetical protein
MHLCGTVSLFLTPTYKLRIPRRVSKNSCGAALHKDMAQCRPTSALYYARRKHRGIRASQHDIKGLMFAALSPWRKLLVSGTTHRSHLRQFAVPWFKDHSSGRWKCRQDPPDLPPITHMIDFVASSIPCPLFSLCPTTCFPFPYSLLS